MKKIISCILILVTILVIFAFPVYAIEDVYVTKNTFGDDNTIHTVLIGYNVVSIEDGSFSALINLKEIKVDSKNPYYASYMGVLYNKDFTQLICIPQALSKAYVRNSITSYTKHALDGLSEERKAKVDKMISKDGGINTTENHSQQITYQEPIQNTVPSINEMTSVPTQIDELIPLRQTVGKVTEFSQYIYKDKNGDIAFYYTGNGYSSIIIPDGVEVIYGFGPHADEITYIYIPHSVYIAYSHRFEWTTGASYHDVLYECKNLKQVESDSKLYRVKDNGTYVYSPTGNGIWSTTEVFPF